MSETQPIRSTRFRREREADWVALEGLVARVESSGGNRLSFDESRSLAALYRKAATSCPLPGTSPSIAACWTIWKPW